MHRITPKHALCGKNIRSGLTLLELLLYIGIVAFVLMAVGAIGFNVLFQKAKLTAMHEVGHNGRFAVEHMMRATRNAQAILAPMPGFTAATLSLQVVDAQKNPTMFYADAGALWMKEGATQAVSLTADEVEVNGFLVRNLSRPSTPGTARMELQLRAYNPENRSEYEFSQIFYGTENIRKKQ